jgi:putative transposase
VLSATVSYQAGRWYVSVQIREAQAERLVATADPVGIDLGIKVLATVRSWLCLIEYGA